MKSTIGGADVVSRNTDMVVATGLTVALFMAIYFRMNELATNIASGLIGYIGGAVAKGGLYK